MPEPPKHRVTRRGKFSKATGYAGTEAGKEEKYRRMQREKYKQHWLQQKGWGGIGGVSKRPKDWEKQFSAWYDAYMKKKAKNKGQKKAVKKADEKAE